MLLAIVLGVVGIRRAMRRAVRTAAQRTIDG